MNINGSIAKRIANISNAVPNFYNYHYDGTRGTRDNYIADGGGYMYNGGNKVSNTKKIKPLLHYVISIAYYCVLRKFVRKLIQACNITLSW